MRVGIDASNIRGGGGVTHLAGILGPLEPAEHGIREVVVWAGRGTLDRLPERPWLRREHDPLLDRGLPWRLWWRRRVLPRRLAGCDVLFVPGGAYGGSFRPFVTMSQNLLPFDRREADRYGPSAMRLRLALLARAQRSTFRAAAGVVFLTEAARRIVEAEMGPVPGRAAVVPHGVTPGMARPPRAQEPLSAYSRERPFRWLYVSIVDVYKHQWRVAEAAVRLRRAGVPVELELVGPAYGPALAELERTLDRHPGSREYVRYHPGVAAADLPARYHAADAFVFASTCETFGIVLLDAMAAGLPVSCSDHPVMREVLGGHGELFAAEDPADVARAMARLMEDPGLRARHARAAFARAQELTWERCARETFAFVAAAAPGLRPEPSAAPPALQRTIR